jgi:ketosteroid isomerase-like protein
MRSHDIVLTEDPAEHPAVFARAFNTGDAAAVERVYESGAVFVAEPGTAVTGAARSAANRRFLDLGLPIEVRPRHVYVAGDVALLIVDWSIEGDGVAIAGTATDVARRGADGRWRYVIDNPFGTAGSPVADVEPGAGGAGVE